ncbi:hypothetical protein G3I59_05775 [Amycolatopsis rubida]|uniref:Uncharacterized protein n=1 Tax=Amycolatopsis rubida TaxID=112413 RepID=A0ABX0BI82_9PSEU|nr:MULTISPECIES: hypothetical protein [Amycolatopsis]MYW90139.1 hypothetical protein [Amycolatopsis rubida]NEC55116.1 hypothetical protein [Amycolatopsis rubida]OAP28598.1 hypothetical protein A4R44_00389 [Amycolatopsis sp. M39]
MTVRSRVTDEVTTWLAGEFAGRVPAEAVKVVVRAAGRDLDGRVVPDEHGDLLYRVARARLVRMLAAPGEPHIPRSRR